MSSHLAECSTIRVFESKVGDEARRRSLRLARLSASVCLYAPTSGERLECVAAPRQLAPLENVQLWWPRNYGRQPLYTLEVRRGASTSAQTALAGLHVC